jgi:hypothetical protein
VSQGDTQSQLTTWILVILGWLIVNATNNGRELRKEARSAADAAKKLGGTISGNAVTYFTTAKDELAYDVKSELELLEIELERLRRFEGSILFEAYVAFQESCTGGDFESAARVQHTKNSEQILGIVRARNILFQEIEQAFAHEYCSFWLRLQRFAKSKWKQIF